MACCRLLGGSKQRAIRHRNGLLQSPPQALSWPSHLHTRPTGRLAWCTISKTSLNGSVNPPISSFLSSKLIKKHFCKHLPCWLLPEDKMWEWKLAGRAHKGRARGKFANSKIEARSVEHGKLLLPCIFRCYGALGHWPIGSVAILWRKCFMADPWLLYDQTLPYCIQWTLEMEREGGNGLY